MKTVLQDKKILLTRPENQYADWANKLVVLGAKPISFPLIELKPVSDNQEIRNVVAKFDTYDWIVFTSTNAAGYFIDILKTHHVGSVNASIAAVGSKTAAFLEQIGYSVDFIPGLYTAKELAESIPGVYKRKMLLPRTDIADDELATILSRRGAYVDEVVVYSTQKLTNARDQLQHLINEGLDVITFASPSVVEAFYEMGINRGNTLIACIGPVTGEKAKEKGMNPEIIAKTYTAEGLTQAISEYYMKFCSQV